MRRIREIVDSRAEIERTRDLIAQIQGACRRARTVIDESRRIMEESSRRERLHRERLCGLLEGEGEGAAPGRDVAAERQDGPPQSRLRPFMQGSDLDL
jgi:hypothetical protein